MIDEKKRQEMHMHLAHINHLSNHAIRSNHSMNDRETKELLDDIAKSLSDAEKLLK